MLQAGFRVDRWEVESVLGQGGMATVYAVRHVALGTRQALKVLSVHNPTLAERLLREGKLQGGVRHPNIVGVTDLVEVQGAPGLVLELVDGPSLEHYLSRTRPTPEIVDAIARGLIAGIEAAHRQGLVHRDLKPANVLLAFGEDTIVPKITDFGLVKALGDASGGGTRPGALLGTPGYMAPEQLRDPSRVDARADLFGLGALLYELVTGRPPFSGQDPIALYERMCDRRYVPVRELVPDASTAVVSAIDAALEPDPSARVRDAATLRELWTGERTYERPVRVEPTSAASVATWALDAALPSVLALPRYARDFVGRERERRDVDAALARAGLVTLVGTGGVGKTRLAAEVAASWADTGGVVVWVDLQEALDERDLARSLAWALEVRDDARPDAVARALKARGEVLVVLDNLEQLLTPDSVAPRLIGGWADEARSARLLATSRLPIGVRGERVVRLEPLEVPATDEELRESAVLALLRGATPDERAIDRDLPLIRRLLSLLDGLPLAIELAAARLEVLDLEDLVERLTRDLGVLSSPGDVGRHGALERTIEWSWSLLGARERDALAQASVFRGGFGLDAAEAVLDVPGGVLDALHGLVRRSLLVRDRGRMRMLESIRAYAASRLGEQDEEEAARRHAAFFGSMARSWCDRRVTAVSRHLDEMAREAPNLEAVVRRAAGDPSLVDDALWCGTALAFLSDVRGPADTRIGVADAILALAGGDDRPRVQVHRLRARWRRRRGDVEGARADLALARRLAEEAGHEDLVTRLVANEADLYLQIGEVHASFAAYERALASADALGMDDIAAVALATMALLARDVGRSADEQDALAAAALRRAAHLGDATIELEATKAVGTAYLERNAWADADARFERGILLAEQLGDQRAAAVMTGQRGLIAESLGDLDNAEQRFRRVVDAMRIQGDPTFVAYYEGFLGRVLIGRGEWAAGVQALESAHRALGSASDPTFREMFAYLIALDDARQGREEPVAAWAALGNPEDARRVLDRTVLVRLAEAVAAERDGRRASAVACADEAEQRAMADKGLDLGVARIVRSVVEELKERLAAWWFAADGSWMEPPTGERVDLARHAANARILALLVDRRHAAPGEPCDVEALADAGWPGERIVSTAAANRVRVALSALRKAGLEPLLQRDRAGWMLDPEAPIRVV